MRSITLTRFNALLLCGVLSGLALYLARPVLIPVTFAAFFAMLFTPLCSKAEAKGVKRVFTSLFSILLLMISFFLIALIVFAQVQRMVDDFPAMEKKSTILLTQVESFITEKFNISKQEQSDMLDKQVKAFYQASGTYMKALFSNLTGFIADAVLVIIFMFLFLYQREKYETFFIKLCSDSKDSEARKMISRISKVAQHYLTGRLLSIMIFIVLFTVGFLIVGIKNAFLLAMIAAILTIIPYVGSIVGGLLPFAIAMVSEESNSTAFGALAVVIVVQGIDNYFIEPYIIGGEVNISAFFTILILFIGGLLWGVAGMILFIPMLGVAKIIFDTIPELEPYGYLVGDQQSGRQSTRMWEWVKSKFKKLRKKK